MPTPHALLNRLDEIGRALETSGHALALLGLGSVGSELARLDEYSDLDFFVIVEDGYKARYLDNLDWLETVAPIAYHFRNTADGYKLLFGDGIFCEFAIFEMPELRSAAFAHGRIIWKRAGVDERIAIPSLHPFSEPRSVEWLVGEALTNLYVGLCRVRRGEKLSGGRFIQQYAVDRILELAPLVEREAGTTRDAFGNERRFEQRFPALAQELPHFVQGYERSPESAQAILSFLEQHWAVNPAMASAIRELTMGHG